jgi:hypothetical protein
MITAVLTASAPATMVAAAPGVGSGNGATPTA